MQKRIRFINWPTTGLLLVLSLSISGFFMPKALDAHPDSLPPLDLTLGYSQEKAHAHLASMGAQGRERYRHVSQVWDTIYPIVYSLFFISLIALLSRRAGSQDAGTKSNVTNWLFYLPPVTLAVDLLENWSIMRLLEDFPDLSGDTVMLASSATSLKWMSVGLTLVVIVTLFFKKRSTKDRRA